MNINSFDLVLVNGASELMFYHFFFLVNHGTLKGMGCFIPFLNFLWLLSFFHEIESDSLPGERPVNSRRLRLK